MRKLKTKFYGALGVGCCMLTLFLMLTNACKNEENVKGASAENASGNDKLKTNDTGTPYVCITNSTTNTIEVYDYNSTTWNSTSRLWYWAPTVAEGFTATGVSYWDTPNDQRVRYSTGFPGRATSAVAVVSHQCMAVASYVPDGTGGTPKGDKLWGDYFVDTENPNIHACELLPDGNLAVAAYGGAVAGKGAWLRVYNTTSTSSTNYVSVPLTGAHAVLWDPTLNILWAGGQITISGVPYFGIFAYTYGGTRAAPTLTEIVSRRSVRTVSTSFNDGGLRYPHDIQPDFDDTNKLIYGDQSGVYSYDKTTQNFTILPGAAGRFYNVALKAAGKQANGGKYVMSEAINSGSCIYSTNKVDFYDGTTGALSFTRTVPGCTIYRARIWTRPYN